LHSPHNGIISALFSSLLLKSLREFFYCSEKDNLNDYRGGCKIPRPKKIDDFRLSTTPGCCRIVLTAACPSRAGEEEQSQESLKGRF
jgi:hypothetical protein